LPPRDHFSTSPIDSFDLSTAALSRGLIVAAGQGSRRPADRRSGRLLRRLFRGSIEPGESGVYVGIDIENIVSNGDVARALPPCSACHRTNAGGPIETPTLTGQYPQYLEAQLAAFASGARHNDIYHRMRNVAAKLTPDEAKLLAVYYSRQ
jgi:cytochrome c553